LSRLWVLVLRELIGPWAFGVAIFTALIMTILYLFQVTEYLAQGVEPGTVLEMTVLFLPGVLAKTFAMAALLASLQAFGRLSGDSEVVAMRAAGLSLGRIMMPVAAFGLAVAVATFLLNELVVPPATLRAETLKEDIVKQIRSDRLRPLGYPVFEKGVLVAQLNARDFDLARKTLKEVNVVVFNRDSGKPAFYLNADSMVFENDREWRIRGRASIVTADGSSRIELTNGLWPREVPRLDREPKDLLASRVRNLDSFSMAEFREQIRRAKADRVDDRQVANLEYGYYNKIALPLAAFVFALVGAPLGIRNHRTGAAAGYVLSVAIILGYFVLSNVMGVLAQGRNVPPIVASFLPVVVGTVLAVATIRRKNH